MPKCEVTGEWGNESVWGIHKHHYIKQQQYHKDPQWFIDNGLHQRIIYLNYKVHDCLHHRSEKTFMAEYGDEYGIKRSDLLWNRKEWLNDQY